MFSDGDSGRCDFFQARVLAIALKAVYRPFSRRREVEFVICRAVWRAYESLETGVVPEIVRPIARAKRGNADAVEVTIDRISESERAAVAPCGPRCDPAH